MIIDQSFPTDSIQSTIFPSKWWEKSSSSHVSRGHLVKAFVPFCDQVPHKFTLKGRQKAEDHGSARIEISALRITETQKDSDLPVAAMSLPKGELWTAYRAKKRPCIVIGDNRLEVEKDLVKDKPNWQRAPTYLVAPYYGADEGVSRSGFRESFVERIKHATYSQLMLDMLPLGGSIFSVLRLDQIQPIGAHYQAYEQTGYQLSEDALVVLDEWIDWLIYGDIIEHGFIHMFQQSISETFK